MSVNNLFCDQQHGSVPGRSCITQLLTSVEIWTQVVEDGNPVDVIYLNFQKAFDQRLIRKLAAYGVTEIKDVCGLCQIDRNQCGYSNNPEQPRSPHSDNKLKFYIQTPHNVNKSFSILGIIKKGFEN